ncbi:hypothetical protein [[Mycoplasma] anseris]|uniref:Lipoprotein n=1 Tax=[Mycoplasma] anseris TaxID=92400 RepID=A0A2Z4ND51_9BACT|nr:hypothetical protein [[Mycoplasma] anseris]AWX69504.1 hypothetical protein DP065_01925 [[Mycoplasma] anseris]
MKNSIKKKILLTLASISTLVVPLTVISCAKYPTIEVKKENLKYDEQEKIFKIPESASWFHDFVRLNPNPIHPEDPAYDIYVYKKGENGEKLRDENGEFIILKDEKTGFEKVNNTHKPAKFLPTYDKYFNLGNLSANYDFRIGAWTGEEFAKHYPYAASKSFYKQHLNKKNILFFTIYYVTKDGELANGFEEFAKQSDQFFNKTFTTLEKAWWPVLPGMFEGGQNWKNQIDPIVVTFERE